MNVELLLILEKFPEIKELVRLKFERDEEFKALCLDYSLCLRSLERWEEDIKRLNQRYNEYTELKRILEEKLLHYIDKEQKFFNFSANSDSRNPNNS